MKVAVVKYNAGNIRSVDYALKRLGVEAVITADKEELQSADKVIFPGVGEAETTMNHLKATGLDELIRNLHQPVFGICLGMQLMCHYSEEGGVDCLNIFDVDVKRFIPKKHEDKVPHMGWNTIGKVDKDSPKKSLSILCIVSMFRYVTLLLLKQIILIRLVLLCIKTIFMQLNSIRRKVERPERRFCGTFWIYNKLCCRL